MRETGSVTEAGTAQNRRVVEGVLRMTLPLTLSSPDHVHCYLLDMPGGRTLLVDTGMRGSEQALDHALSAAGTMPDDVLVTHGHVDHWGLARTLTPEVLGHENTARALRFDRENETVFGEHDLGVLDEGTVAMALDTFQRLTVGDPPSVRLLEDGAALGEWTVLWTPGHDAGHLCLFRASDGVLICGDALLPDNTPNIQPAAGRADALADFLGSLERLAALDVSLVLPAHGEPFTDHIGRAAALRAFHQRRLQLLERELSGPPRAVSDLSRALFPLRESPIDDMLADMETLAHLDHLRLRARAVRLGDHRWTLGAAA